VTVIDVHAHLYPRAFMEAVAAHGPAHGVRLTTGVPPTLCFEGIDFWRYTPAFWDEDARLREMDAAGVDRQVISLGPPMAYWAEPEFGLQLSMKPFLGRLDDTVILEGLQKTRLGIPRSLRISERAVTLTEDFLLRIGALKARIGYDKLVTNDFLPK